MPNPLKDKLQARFLALQKQRTEMVARQAGELATLDGQISALRTLAQNWDSMTVEQALTALDQTGIRLELQS